MFNCRLRNTQNVTGMLISLRRFFQPHVPTYSYWMEQVSKHLQQLPDQRKKFTQLRSDMVSIYTIYAHGRTIKVHGYFVFSRLVTSHFVLLVTEAEGEPFQAPDGQ